MSIVIGIDPGQSGGIALARGEGCWKLPETEKDIYDLLYSLREPNRGCDVWLEKVHSMPRQGVASSFKFGQNYGFLRGVVTALGFRLFEVTPQKWQKAMGCLTRGDKNVSKAAAQRLFPSLKITHATADALLIAEYGRRNTP